MVTTRHAFWVLFATCVLSLVTCGGLVALVVSEIRSTTFHLVGLEPEVIWNLPRSTKSPSIVSSVPRAPSKATSDRVTGTRSASEASRPAIFVPPPDCLEDASCLTPDQLGTPPSSAEQLEQCPDVSPIDARADEDERAGSPDARLATESRQGLNV